MIRPDAVPKKRYPIPRRLFFGCFYRIFYNNNGSNRRNGCGVPPTDQPNGSRPQNQTKKGIVLMKHFILKPNNRCPRALWDRMATWSPAVGLILAAAFVAAGLTFATPLAAKSMKVKVMKACETCVLPAAPARCQSAPALHVDRADVWVPKRTVRIHAVSVPEQTEISIYNDIELSTSRLMYQRKGHIFRAKYAGPMISREPACESTYSGSNITNTNIVFPSNLWIEVKKGVPIYVHVDIINWSPFEINPMAQDVYIYYTEVR